MACNITLPESNFALPNEVTMDVTSKIRQLSEEALSIDSIYMRAKDTFKELMDGKKITEAEYAQLAGSFVSQLAVSTTQQVISSAMAWAKEERDGMYELEALKAQSELVQAQREKIRLEICALEKDVELKCAQLTATIAGSIRDNGRVATYDPSNSCIPITLQPEGTKYQQEQFIESQKYSNLADAYRKSGVVQVGTDTDGTLKGLSGDNIGYTDAQEEFARRQIKSFEDSKRNHAANAMSQMIGQMLSAEVAPDAADITRWRNAIDYLNTNTP